MNRYGAYLATRHFPSLDGVRCLSILGVIWHHIPQDGPLPLIARRGFLGVDMFFILSGFLVTTVLLGQKSQGSGVNAVNLNVFYQRRALRIFPAYYVLLVIFALIYLILGIKNPRSVEFFQAFPFYLTFTANWLPTQAANFGILWASAAEEQFYWVWPGIVKWVDFSRLPMVLAGGLVINQIMNFNGFDPVFDRLLGTHQLEIVDITFTPMILGCGLAYGLRIPQGFAWLERGLAPGWTSLAYGILLGVCLQTFPGDLSGFPRLGIQLTMTAFLGALVMPRPHPLQKLLDFPAIVRIGQVSYGMYLYHMWVIHGVKVGGSWEGVTLFIPVVAVTYGVAELSFWLWERPFILRKPPRPGAHA